MLKRKFFLLPAVLLACSGTLSLSAAKPPADAEQIEFFESKIRPLLSSKCFACHGSEMQMAGLNLATAASFFKGGESGPVVVKGEPENSRLISAVNYQGQIKMPPTGKLKEAEIADLVAWIKIGAPWPNAGTATVVVEKPKGYQYSLASIFASTKSLAKVEGTVSQLYFAPLVTKEVADRFNAHQEKLKAKQEDIDEVTGAEADRHAAALRAQMPKYLPAAWQYENRPGSMADLKLSDFARQHNLDAVLLERWITYLKPSIDVRPHLQRWYEATDAATAALSRSETQQKLPDPPATLAEIARSFQEELKALTGERSEARQAHKKRVAEARRLDMPPPERINIDVARQRFLTDVTDKKGPLALPENEPEKLFSAESLAKVAELRKELDVLKAASPSEPPMACAVTEGPSVQQKVFIRGNWANPGEDAPKQFLRIIVGEQQTPVTKGSGRLELAEWLTQSSHPLTSRVMVNRLWQWHFGEGLVRTPSNFGKLGEMPTHPELLDYLARQFVKQGWSIKAMHRLIMLSSAYQMGSEISSQAAQMDPDNRLLAHMNRRRLDAEEIRDGMLALTGQLDLTVGGTLQSGFGTDGENSSGRLSINPDTSVRRTVYLPIRRSNLPSLFNLFDFGDATTPGEGRARTNVSPQALYMMNGEAVGKRSRELARTLLEGSSSDDQRIALAYRRTLGRVPSVEEVRESLGYVESYRKKSLVAAQASGAVTTPNLEAWQSFCRVLLSSNEFIYVD